MTVNSPHGFVSKLSFRKAELASKLRAIRWFTQCGQPLHLDLTMPTERITDWQSAVASCQAPVWENVELEAQNQLTLWLYANDRTAYQNWNDIVDSHKTSILNPLTEQTITPFQVSHGLDVRA